MEVVDPVSLQEVNVGVVDTAPPWEIEGVDPAPAEDIGVGVVVDHLLTSPRI